MSTLGPVMLKTYSLLLPKVCDSWSIYTDGPEWGIRVNICPPSLTDRLVWAYSDWLTSSGFMELATPHSVKPWSSTISDSIYSKLLQLILAREFVAAVGGAARIARAANMERAFTTAPTASCSYRYKDLDGFTTTPEIAPPISRHVDRDSGTFGVESFDYGDVEIASEVGWDTYKKVVDEICRTFEVDWTIPWLFSFNSWSDVVTYDQAFINDWFDSPQTSLYYALQVMPDTLRKDDVSSLLEGDDYADLFGFSDLDADDNDPLLFFLR